MRPVPAEPATLLDTDPASVSSVEPLPVACFVDGIQSSRTVTHREHRPVHLVYVAAGALGAGGAVLGVHEELSLVVSASDQEWAEQLPGGVPVVALDAQSPFELAAEAVEMLGGARDRLERSLVTELLEREVGTVVVDGSLLGRPTSPAVVGVAKTTATRYLADESVLLNLPEGWRSPRFIIPAGVGGGSFARASCYLRLTDARFRGWDYGLIRLESSDPEILDSFASRCLAERQPTGNADPRGDRHLSTIATIERVLRSRRPHLFS